MGALYVEEDFELEFLPCPEGWVGAWKYFAAKEKSRMQSG